VLGIAAVLVIAGAVLQLTPDDDSDEVVPPLRPQTPLGEVRSVSIDFGVVTDPETDRRGSPPSSRTPARRR